MVLFSWQFNLVAFGLVVHQRSVKVGFIGDVLEVFGRQRLNVFGIRKRIDHPAGRLAIINTNYFLSVDGDLRVHLQGTLELHNKCAFHASREGDAAGNSFGLDGFDLLIPPRASSAFLTISSAVSPAAAG